MSKMFHDKIRHHNYNNKFVLIFFLQKGECSKMMLDCCNDKSKCDENGE